MNEKQNEHFPASSNQNDPFELNVTITPAKNIPSSLQKNNLNEKVNDQSKTNMAGNIQMPKNSSQPNNGSNSISNQQITSNNSNSNQLNPPPKSLLTGFLANSQNNPLFSDPKFVSILQELFSSKNAGNTQPPKPLLQAKTLSQSTNPQPQQPKPNLPINSVTQPIPPANQPLPNKNTKPSYIPIQQTNNSANTNKNIKYNSCMRICGYRFNNNNQIEYQIRPPLNSSNPSDISPISYCPSIQMTDFEGIRQFWLHNNGYNENNPREPINKPKKKKKRYVDSSSNSPSPKASPSSSRIHSNTKDGEKDNKFKEKKVSLANLPSLLSIDREPKVNILGIVQRLPIIKIAIQREGFDKMEIVTSAEARKVFPMQLSKYYEQFITFIDYE